MTRISGLSTRVLAIAILPILLLAVVLVAFNAFEASRESAQKLEEQREMMVKVRQDGLRDVVQMAKTAVAEDFEVDQAVETDVAVAVARRLRALRFEGENYVFAFDTAGVFRVQPAVLDLEGKNQSGLQDANGNFFIKGMIDLAVQGGGFYNYYWKNPKTGAVEEKYSYVELIPELGWVIGAGIYMTDIDAAMALLEAQAAEDLQAAMLRTSLVSLAVMLLIAVLVWPICRRLTGRIKAVIAVVREIAEQCARGEGDLTRRVPVSGGDEIAAMALQMNAFLESIQKTLLAVRVSIDAVDEISSGIAQHSQELAARTEQAAANLQQTSSSMEEITVTVQHSASSAAQANGIAGAAARVAEDGQSAMLRAESTMGEILDASRQIAEIITMIDAIAFQTNILALNASVEAARAGEHGRGFAVVAQEVRTLAERSRLAAQDIRGLIQSTGEKIMTGEQVIRESGETMQQILQNIGNVGTAVDEISQASREQSSGILQINTAVAEMDAMTQRNSSMVHELSLSARSMQEQMADLHRRIAAFRLEGAPAAAQRPHRHEVRHAETQAPRGGHVRRQSSAGVQRRA